jgi:hypothetical protein
MSAAEEEYVDVSGDDWVPARPKDFDADGGRRTKAGRPWSEKSTSTCPATTGSRSVVRRAATTPTPLLTERVVYRFAVVPDKTEIWARVYPWEREDVVEERWDLRLMYFRKYDQQWRPFPGRRAPSAITFARGANPAGAGEVETSKLD